ncbi:uncharacterized protein LOC142520181 [Primulina tabacum]|uniref:uncharacterized protein LOC142520181 n=1 Tax=Primulina tabacum TaxID=48773 RepID=UPI003F596644
MARTKSRLDNMETHMGNMGAKMKSLETQIGQLANALKDQNMGQFPSNTEVNPKEQCKAVILRSGKELKVHIPKERVESEKTVEESKNEESKTEVEVERPPVYKPTLPYPQRFKKKNLDEIKQMPNYAKFIKDVMSKKRKLQEFETVNLTEECSAILQKKLPQKLKDPGNMEEDHDAPLIFGRLFLATGRALIDVHKGELTLRVSGEAVIFNIYHAMKGSNEVSTCKSIDILDSCMSLSCAGTRDPLECCLTSAAGSVDEDNWEVKEQLLALEASQKERKIDAPPEELDINEKIEVKAPSPDLKELPSHLCYVFLGEKSTYPVIIYSSLTCTEKDKLLRVLRKFKTALGWLISDIRGISPTICMHKILMEESYTPSVDHQRRLNPAMKDVVKNEVLKLLNAGVIYAISDSSWVSHVQVVPKKGGITVVRNENDELISTRTVTGWRVCIDYRKLNNATRKDHFPLPFIDQMLDRLASYCHYCFLDGYSGYNQIAIAPEDEEKTTFTCPYGTFAFWRMPFGLCNAPATFQRCMMAIFADMVEEIMEVFMDEFSAFEKIKMALVTAPIMIVPDWKEPFELMCDASDYAVGVVLGQRRDKMFRAIYYASRTMDVAQQNYTTTEKEMLAVVFAFDKFRPYLIGTKDKKGSENQVADHLSRLELEEKKEEGAIQETFPDEQLFEVNTVIPCAC